MTKFLCFSDFHFFHSRVDTQISTCEWISDMIRKEKPDVVVNCGDTNHTHGYIDIITLEAMTRGMKIVIEAASEVEAEVWFISGNHDQSSKDGLENAISAFENLSPSVVCATTYPAIREIKGERAILAPYCNPGNIDHLNNYIKIYQDLVESRDPTIQFSHWEITGCEYMPNGKTSDHGIKAEDFKYPIINGHYHHPKIYNKKYNKIYIVGSPCYYNYSDKVTDNPRGVMIYEEGNVKWLENPHTEIYHTVSPKDLTPKLLASLPKERTKLRVRVDTPEDVEALQELTEDIDENDWKSIKIYNKIKSSLAVSETTKIDFDLQESYRDLLSNYLKEKGCQTDENLLNLGVSIIESACTSRTTQ